MDGLPKVKFLAMLFLSVYDCNSLLSKCFGYNSVLVDIGGITRSSPLRTYLQYNFTHLASSQLSCKCIGTKANVNIQTELTLTGLLWDTNLATWLTFYCFGTSCDNTLYRLKRFSHIHEVIIKSGLAKCSVNWFNAKQVIPYSLFWQYLMISFFAYMPDCLPPMPPWSNSNPVSHVDWVCRWFSDFTQKQAFDISKF